MFVGLNRMRFHLDDVLASQGENPLEAGRGCERREREQEVVQAVAPNQHAVHEPTVCAVEEPFLHRLKGEVSPHEGAGRQQAAEKHIRAEVHVVMAVEAGGIAAVEAAEVVDLGGDDVLERSHERWIEHKLRQPVPAEMRGDSTLVLGNPGRARRGRERRREVQVQTGVDAVVDGHRGGAIGVFHEHHGADRRDGLPGDAIEDAPSRTRITPPVVGIHDHETALTRVASCMRRTG